MMQGLMGGIVDKFRGDEGSARLYGLGLLASQLGAGQAPDASPALAMLDQRKAQKAFKASMTDPGMMDMFSDQERAFLSTLPPSAAQSLIAQRVFAGPAAPIEVNGQLVDPTTGEVVGDYRTPETVTPVTINGQLVNPQTGQVMGDYRTPDADPAKVAELRFRAEQAGLRPGTPEYQEFMREGSADGVNVTNIMGGGELTPFEEKRDEAFAADYLAWTQGGGADMTSQLASVSGVLGRLEAGEELTGTAIGAMPDWMLAITNPEAMGARDAIEEVVQRNLRLILGAQFTENEGNRLIARAYNPRLSPSENAGRLRKLFTQMEAAAAAKNAMAEYVEQNGTLRGYQGAIPTIADFEAVMDGDGSEPSVNQRLRYNPATGEFE